MPGLPYFITCEHGGNMIPEDLSVFFAGAGDIPGTHRGYDIGALDIATRLASGLDAALFYSETTRLAVDLNRSVSSRSLFSEFTSALDKEEKKRILEKYYFPYRKKVEDEITRLASMHLVIHIAVHSFTPVLYGKTRNAEIGLLYDPKRIPEKKFCAFWKDKLKELLPEFRTRMNYPYKGISDCLGFRLKKNLKPENYIGVELEVNQAVFGDKEMAGKLYQGLLKSLVVLKDFSC